MFSEIVLRRPSLKGTDQIFSLGLQKFRLRISMWRLRIGIGVRNFGVLVDTGIKNVRCVSI